jgi:hypothetical protein
MCIQIRAIGAGRDDERKGEEDHGACEDDPCSRPGWGERSKDHQICASDECEDVKAEEDTPVMIGHAVVLAFLRVAEEYSWESKNRDGKREHGIEEEVDRWGQRG